MTTNLLMFYIFASIIIIFSIMTVTSRRILRAAVYLLFVLVSTSAMYFLLHYFFLAAVQLTLYAGGIVVLIIFSILLTSHIDERFKLPSIGTILLTATSLGIGAILTIVTILQYPFKANNAPEINSNVALIGQKLMDVGKYGYALPFEFISILLLAAMVAAIVIAKKRKD